MNHVQAVLRTSIVPECRTAQAHPGHGTSQSLLELVSRRYFLTEEGVTVAVARLRTGCPCRCAPEALGRAQR